MCGKRETKKQNEKPAFHWHRMRVFVEVFFFV